MTASLTIPALTEDLKGVLIDADTIRKRVADLARQIDKDYEGTGELLIVGVLKGAFIFTADLTRALTKEHVVDFIALSSYTGDKTTGNVRLLMDTRQNILSAGMTPIGAGENMSQAATPVLLAETPRPVWLVPSLRLALENYAYLPDKPCVSQEPMDSLLCRVAQLRQADPSAVIIVSLHWGGEHTMKPVSRQRLEARQLISAGADVLVCHHTHTLQSIETYEGKYIYYSIGNFIFDQQKPINSQACMVKLHIKKDHLEVETLPIEIHQCIPYLSH